jgi:hypothetical protein
MPIATRITNAAPTHRTDLVRTHLKEWAYVVGFAFMPTSSAYSGTSWFAPERFECCSDDRLQADEQEACDDVLENCGTRWRDGELGLQGMRL